MRALKKILVAVKRPGVGQAATLRKAAQLAVGLGAELELFHALTTPIYLGPMPGGADWRQLRDREQARAVARLERTAVRLRRSGARVAVKAVWDYPSFGALLRRARQTRADLIVAERHAGGHTAPWLLRYTDWELLRQSPVPVLLVKKSRPWQRPTLLAGLDPFHEFAKPAKLDREILTIGGVLAKALGGTLHAAHVYLAPTFRAGAGAEGRALVDMYRDRARDSAEAALRRELKGHAVPPRQVHLVPGHPADELPKLAKLLGAEIAIMGAVSRGGLRRLVVGNTAEAVFDALACDILVIKPAGFHSKVPSRVRGPTFVLPPDSGVPWI
jgi:universal stress protein E